MTIIQFCISVVLMILVIYALLCVVFAVGRYLSIKQIEKRVRAWARVADQAERERDIQ